MKAAAALVLMMAAAGMIGFQVDRAYSDYWWGRGAYLPIDMLAMFIWLFAMRKYRTTTELPPAGEEETPEDRQRPALPPGTVTERRLDLKAMVAGHLSIEEFLDRWSGREIMTEPDLHALLRKQISEEVDKELRRQVDAAEPKKYPCTNCLGLHLEGEKCPIEEIGRIGGVSNYVTVEELTAPRTGVEYVESSDRPRASGQYNIGDKVRVIYPLHHLYDRICTVEALVATTDGRPRPHWRLNFGGSHYDVYEPDFTYANPKKGEVWNQKECDECNSKFGGAWTRTLMNVNQDWVVSDISRARINCGCLYRIGVQDKKVPSKRFGITKE